MAIDSARAHLARFGLNSRIRELGRSSATVTLAAQALGTNPERIAKSLAFLVGTVPTVMVAAGDAKVANTLFRQRFGVKPRMIGAGDIERLVGHAAGGVCPFGVEPNVVVHLDESLRRFATVFPAAGSPNSAVELSIEELERSSGSLGWVQVCRIPSEATQQEAAEATGAAPGSGAT